jgi:hypothetical protein
MNRTSLLLAALLLSAASAFCEDARLLFESNFKNTDVGKPPADFMILDGDFAIQFDSTNKVLELPGAPLETFCALFGPTVHSNVVLTARIRATSKGRRSPTFGIGLNGQSGYKLQLSPGKQALELYRADEQIASVPCDWKTGQWTILKLRLAAEGDAWKIEGSAWLEGTPEPAKPLLEFKDTKQPPAGRASIWGSPFSTTPIDYDSLVLRRIE